MSRELIEFCQRVANAEITYIPHSLRPLIAAEYEKRSGLRLKCRCPEAITDAAIWLAVELSEEDGAKGGECSRLN